MNTCKKCNEPFTGNYCSNCGQPAKLKRINTHYILHEIGHVLHIEGQILHTIKGLVVNPGKTVQYYIKEDRSRHVKPVIFIITTSLIYTLVCHLFHIQYYGEQLDTAEKSTTILLFNWLQAYSGYANIVIGVFVAFLLKIFFRKYDYNLFEIFVFICFIFGMEMLIFAVLSILQRFIHFDAMLISSGIVTIYFTWATGQFFDGKEAGSYLKAFLSYILGMVVFTFLLVYVGILIDVIIGH